MEQPEGQMLSTSSIRLQAPDFMAGSFFSKLFVLPFDLPSGFRASGLLFFSFSSEVQFCYEWKWRLFVIFTSIQGISPEEKYQLH